MCMTWERSDNTRGNGRKNQGKTTKFETISSDSEADHSEDEGKQVESSARRCYWAKIMSKITDYSANYEILHFAYDFILWCCIASAKNTLKGKLPLRVALKNHSFSPLYWKTGILD